MALWNKFLKQERGVAAVEFALTASLLVTMLMGGMEASRAILITQKAEKLASTVGDTVASEQSVSQSELNQLFAATTDIMKPYTFGTNGVIIISSVYRAAGSTAVTVNWQRPGGGTLSRTSAIGVEGGAATLPTGFTLDERENVIIAEVYYSYTPMFLSSIFKPATRYRYAIFRPRLGALLTPPA